MKTQNLLSVCQGVVAINENGLRVEKRYKYLKPNETVSLECFCNALQGCTADYAVFNGYCVGYSIPQISKEFDLLRFSDGSLINIELKGALSEDIKEEKILSQMRKNRYYLHFLNRALRIFTFVENDGLYEYLAEQDKAVKTDMQTLVTALRAQVPQEEVDIENEFKPSNYLISPFNKTEAFMRNEYFLTGDQANAKKDIVKGIDSKKQAFYCLSANAGTGKTLLVYDIARTYIQQGKRVKLVHCGMLNDGQNMLVENYGWDVVSINSIAKWNIDVWSETDLLLIDEAQRIRKEQLKLIVKTATEKGFPVLFAYDVNQYLSDGEGTEIYEYLLSCEDKSKIYRKKLTNTIRTNKQIASFIYNLMKLGKSRNDLNYKDVTVEYFDNFEDVKRYLTYLSETDGWQAVTYTTSSYTEEPLQRLATVCETNAHAIIGQEFDKVVFVMDGNFTYDEDCVLRTTKNYYSAKGMLYQIITRVVDKLKIVVLDNPQVYEKLLWIKSKGDK